MKTFDTITGAFNFIKRNLNTGNEQIVNDRIYFGVGSSAYMYTEDAIRLNLPELKIGDGVFTHLTTDEELERAISWTFQVDGYLAV